MPRSPNPYGTFVKLARSGAGGQAQRRSSAGKVRKFLIQLIGPGFISFVPDSSLGPWIGNNGQKIDNALIDEIPLDKASCSAGSFFKPYIMVSAERDWSRKRERERQVGLVNMHAYSTYAQMRVVPVYI